MSTHHSDKRENTLDRFKAMSVVLAVVETGSLSAASRKLGMPLPTVSRKLSELEQHLKARLLVRSTRRLALTDSGRAYVEAARRILEDVGNAERAAAGEFSAPRGELVIAAPIVFGRLHVLPVVTEFLKEYPEVDVRLVLGDRIIDLLEDHVDVALRIGELGDSRLVASRVGSTRRVVCGSPVYFTEHGTPKQPRELGAHRCIAFEGAAANEPWLFRVEGSAVAVPIRPRLVVNTAEAALDAALAGVGLARVLSYQADPAVRSGQLVTALMRFAPAAVPVNLVHAAQRLAPLKLRAFLDFAASRLRERLQGSR